MSEESMNPPSAERLARAAHAAQALSETLWEALHEALAGPMQPRVSELSQRLADVSATVALLARVDASSPSVSEVPPPGVGIPPPESPAARAIHRDAPPPRESPISPESSSMAVLVDELAPREAPEPPLREAPEAPLREAPEIAIRDERGERAPNEWIVSIDRLLERYARDGAPFAVLLVELAGVERLRHAELPGEVSRLTGLVEAALSGELRPADSLTRESPGRYWLLAPETDSGGARALVERLASAVRGAASHRGAPLELAIGIAVCPADGAQAVSLAAHAEVALYAARASGKPVA